MVAVNWNLLLHSLSPLGASKRNEHALVRCLAQSLLILLAFPNNFVSVFDSTCGTPKFAQGSELASRRATASMGSQAARPAHDISEGR